MVVDADALGPIHFWWTDYFRTKLRHCRFIYTLFFIIVERIDGLISLGKILLWRICKDCVVVYTR